MERPATGNSGISGGTLDRTPPLEVFRSLYRERQTAQILLARLGEERTFWFHRGRLLSGASNREAQQIGELLRTFGLADDAVLFAAFERALAEPGRGLSKALRETGAVPGYIADACVRALAEKIFFDTFLWTTGTFAVTPLDAPPELPVVFDASNATLTMEALRRLPADVRTVARIDPRARPILSGDLLMRYQVVNVSTDEAEVIDLVDGVKTAAEVSVDGRVLDRLHAIGLLRVVPPGQAVERADAPDGLAFLNVDVAGASPNPRAAELLEQQTKLTWNTYRRLDWVDLYGVLGATREMSDPDLRRAVHERARVFHPDNAFRPGLDDAREALEALFKKVLAAEEAFRTRESRAEYDKVLDGGSMHALVHHGEPTPEIQKQVAKANYQRARTLFEMEDFYPAYEMIRQSVEFDPDKVEYWVLLAKIQRKNPKWVRQASETLNRAVQRIPDSSELWMALAETYQAQRNEVERVKALKEVLKLDPTNKRAQTALSQIAATKPR